MTLDDLKKQYEELKARTEELGGHLNELRKGHIHFHYKDINIDYHLPEEVRAPHHWVNRLYIWLGASLLGLAAIGFAFLADASTELFREVYNYRSWAVVILTPFGLLLTRFLTDKYFKGAEGSGIPQVIASLNMQKSQRAKLLCVRTGVGKIIGTCLALISGASVGREGPSVQLGAIIFRYFSQILRAPSIYTKKSLILAGGAAGVSAAFNTPVAGIVFAIEELGKSFYEKETSVLMMAIVVSGLTALSISGEYYYFGTTTVGLVGIEKLWSLPIGLFAGVAGGLFSIVLIKGVEQLSGFEKKKLYAYVFIFGLLIAGIGIVTKGATFGTGYEQAKAILEGTASFANFPIAKIFSTLFSYFTGVPGGIFSPTLSIGAGIGSWLSQYLDPQYYQAWVLFGMVGFFSGVIRTPITSVIIVSEMTHNHGLLFPLLLASLSAYGASVALSRESLYNRLAERYLAALSDPPKSTDPLPKPPHQ